MQLPITTTLILFVPCVVLAVICVHQHVHDKWKVWNLLHVSAINCHPQGGVIRGIRDINTPVLQIVLHIYKIYKMAAMSTTLQYSSFPQTTHQYNTTIQLLPTQNTSVHATFTWSFSTANLDINSPYVYGCTTNSNKAINFNQEVANLELAI